MALPKPVPGLVIRYSYLWYGDHLEGREEGEKDRPCAIIAALRADESGNTRVLVLPITHSPPDHASLSVEIPAKVKQRLHLDDARSWVVLSEWNDLSGPAPTCAGCRTPTNQLSLTECCRRACSRRSAIGLSFWSTPALLLKCDVLKIYACSESIRSRPQ